MVEINTNLESRVTASMEESRDFYNGDLWRNGKGLAVRKPTESDKLAEVKEGFASQNVIEEVVDRRRDGILGREPIWTLKVKEGEANETQEKSIAEITDAIVEWWNNRGMLQELRKLFVNGCLDRLSELRPYVPATAYEGSALKSVKTLSEALDLLHFEVISPKSAGVFLEEDSLRPYSIYRYEKDGETWIEVSVTDEENKTHLSKFKENEVSGLAVFPTLANAAQPTWFERIVAYAKTLINQTASDERFDYAPLDLDGKLFLHELALEKPFVSDPMNWLQKQVSLDKTMQGRNTYTAGFRSKHWLNARPPQGEKKISDSTQPTGYKIEKFNLPMKDGAGVNSFVQGAFIYDENGAVKGVATPNVVVTDPVPVTTFIESKTDNRAGILCMAKQEHVLTNMDSSPSGFSRQQARAEFKSDLNGAKVPVDETGRYIVEFAKSFAAALTNRVEEFKQFRCDFNSIVDAGVLSPEEKDDNRKAYEVGEISLQTLQARNGVEDTDAELAQIQSEDGFEINRLDKVLSVLQKSNGILPKKLQIEFLIKSLGKEDEWKAETIFNDVTAEEKEKADALNAANDQ